MTIAAMMIGMRIFLVSFFGPLGAPVSSLSSSSGFLQAWYCTGWSTTSCPLVNSGTLLVRLKNQWRQLTQVSRTKRVHNAPF